MIAKRIEFRNVSVSSFSNLITYITNAQGKNERVGEITVTNCQSEHPTWAAKEAEAVQDQNKRTTIDKTYHLLISFREGDRPSPESLHAIEARMCATLGYQDHQRVSAVHYDTDHTHIHIAINKIHPTNFTAHEPYFDKKNLGVLCTALEKEYKLAPDNHIPRMTKGEAKAQDMEKSAGIESLIGWVKRGCLPELLKVTSWDELHRVLVQNGLKLEQRGNGLVIKDRNDIAAKASSVNRALSVNALEKKLGAFRPCVVQEVKITKSYEAKPMPSKVDTKPLWASYQHERSQQKQKQDVLKQRATERKDRRMEMAKKSAATKRAAITSLAKGTVAKSMMYHAVSQNYLKEVRAIRSDYREDQQKLYEKGKQVVWYDWLKAKAWEGNAQALDVLRNRYEQEPLRANAIGGREAVDKINYRAGATIEAVTKKGTIHYQVAQTVLRDDGRQFRLAEKVSTQVVEAALKLGMQRFGNSLTINGTDEFRKQAVEVGAKLKLVFTNPDLEAQRKALLAVHTSKPDASAIYIAERNETRGKGIDILPHRRYEDSDAGKFSFAGIRQVEGQNLMLLQTSKEMLVLPVDDATVNLAQRLEIGKMVDVPAQGIVHTKSQKI